MPKIGTLGIENDGEHILFVRVFEISGTRLSVDIFIPSDHPSTPSHFLVQNAMVHQSYDYYVSTLLGCGFHFLG
jgi:hypothetical protein